MTRFIWIPTVVVFLTGGADMASAQTPVFETNGFPIALHQAQVTGLASIQERSPTATLTIDGMPASPLQVAVLKPRPRMTHQQVAQKLNSIGFSEIIFDLPSEYGATAMKNGAWIHFTVDSRTGAMR